MRTRTRHRWRCVYPLPNTDTNIFQCFDWWNVTSAFFLLTRIRKFGLENKGEVQKIRILKTKGTLGGDWGLRIVTKESGEMVFLPIQNVCILGEKPFF